MTTGLEESPLARESLPEHTPLGAQVIRNLGVYFAILALIGTSIAVSEMISLRRIIPSWTIVVGALGIPMLVYLTATLMIHRNARRRAKAHVATAAEPWSAAIHSIAGHDVITLAMKSSERLWAPLAERKPRPIAVVDAALTVPPPNQNAALLEEEPITPSQGGMLIAAGIFLLLGTFSLFGRGVARWWNILVFFSLAAYFLSRHPGVRNAVPVLRNTGTDLIAGPGWVRQAKSGKRWTVADSIALVMRGNSSAKQPSVVVRLIGRAGVRDVRFASANDPDFLLWWERWTTTSPRLELARDG
jgi:hypothetical protein